VLRWERARDLAAVIDCVLEDSVVGRAVDPKRIGAVGFSLGGYTVLEVAGARTDLAALGRFCASHPGECSAPPEFPDPEAQFERPVRNDAEVRASLKRAGDSYREGRVRAVFAIAPELGHSFTEGGLAQVEVPVQIIVGDADSIAPATASAAYCAQGIKGARLDVLPRVGHYTFLALPTAKAKAERPSLAVDLPGVDRAVIHAQVAQMAAEFFERNLR